MFDPVRAASAGTGAAPPEDIAAVPDPAPAAPADLPDFLLFTPVPVRARRDGWSAELQFRFLLAIARGASVDEAARGVGRSRQTAYALRARAGAESFAAVWDAATAFAGRMRGAAADAAGALSGLDTLLVPRFYRGRLVGYVAREHRRATMATLARLDRVADRVEARGPGALAELRAAAGRLSPLFGES